MFSGIIESMARVVAIEHEQDNIHFTLTCSFVGELSIDQSIAHNGVCLTVVRLKDDTYTVTANGRLDGHIVQGHVDQTATCIAVEDQQGSHQYTFKYESTREMVKHGYFTVDKGSVTVNGVSLTVCRPTADTFEVCIIPYTYDNTNFHAIKPGSVVNIEFDIIGKYLARMNELTNEK